VVAPGELLQGKGITDLHEGGWRLLVREECPQGLVAAGKAPQNVEDPNVLRDGEAEVAKPISRALHLPAVVSHRQITLLERAKLGVEVEGACLSIPEKLSLEGKPHHARSGIRSPHGVLEIQGDGPRDPGHDDAVAASPRRVSNAGRSVGEDVAVESVAAKSEENLVPPSSIEGRGGVEDDGDQVLDVRDRGSLKVEVGDHGVVRATRGSSTRRGQHSRRKLRRRSDARPRRGVEEVLHLRNLTSERGSRRALLLPGEGSHTRTRSSAAAAAVLAFFRATARALSAATTVEGRGDSLRRKVVAEKEPGAGGTP
jgi:hypothetical protein